MDKHYADRDHMELGNYYTRHVQAMTAEGLHAKSDIAAELAWRDREIARLRALSPAGGGDITGYTEALAHIRATMLAASPQQEPGAVECEARIENMQRRLQDADLALGNQALRIESLEAELSLLTSGTHDPSGQTLAGEGGELIGYVWPNEADYDRIHRCFGSDGDPLVKRVPSGAIPVIVATSAGTTGDDSENAARLPSAQGWLDSHCSVASPDWMRGWDAAREALDDARRAREVGCSLNRCACDVPPPGWACTREKGHPGPCAAVPLDWAAPPAGAVVFAWYDVFNAEFTRDPMQALRAIEGGNGVLPLWADAYRVHAIHAAERKHGTPTLAASLGARRDG